MFYDVEGILNKACTLDENRRKIINIHPLSYIRVHRSTVYRYCARKNSPCFSHIFIRDENQRKEPQMHLVYSKIYKQPLRILVYYTRTILLIDITTGSKSSQKPCHLLHTQLFVNPRGRTRVIATHLLSGKPKSSFLLSILHTIRPMNDILSRHNCKIATNRAWRRC